MNATTVPDVEESVRLELHRNRFQASKSILADAGARR